MSTTIALMPSDTWKGYRCLLSILLVNAAFFGQRGAQAQQAATKPVTPDPVFAAWGQNSEVSQCGLCHYEAGNIFARRNTEFCQLNEVQTWLKNDKHAISRQRIEPLGASQLSQRRQTLRRQLSESGLDPAIADQWLGTSNLLSHRMCQSLGYDVGSADGYAQFRENCLTCHAGFVPGGSMQGFTADIDSAQPGVKCTYCHQTGEERRWIDQHSGIATNHDWRRLAPNEKAEAGMRDLLSPAAQADLCTACHVGDQERGMFISHEMYAAGHPPLPGFELQQFVASMPAHWRSPELTWEALSSYEHRNVYFELNYGRTLDAQQSMESTRAALLGAIVAARRSTLLLSDVDAERWGDYALYDCSGCHHELRTPSLRQARRSGIPGRPRLAEWTNPLFELAINQTTASEKIVSRREALHAALAATPFGDRETCQSLARPLADEIALAEAELQNQVISPASAQTLLAQLLDSPLEALLDYNSARQIIWGIQVIDEDLAERQLPLPPEVRQRIDALGEQAESVTIATRLPSGRGGLLFARDDDITTGFLAEEFSRIRQYDPRIIQSQLDEIQSLLH